MAITENSIYRRIAPGAYETLGGLQFRSIGAVTIMGAPKVGFNVPPDEIGPAVQGADYILAAGTIAAAPGRAAFWARIAYSYEDNREADAQVQAAQQAESDQADAELAAERPQLRSLLAQALQALSADETQRDRDLAALPTATTAERWAILGRMLQREQLRIRLDTRVLRLVAAQAGIPLGSAP